jgi:GNAT superfamily N-acetyltransferase
MSQVTVRLYQPGDEADFRRLNEQWISKYFRLEEKDVATLDDPQKYILDKGGQVFMALLDGMAVGCVALAKMDEQSYELIKMAVDETYQRRGIGRAVMNAAIDWARNQRAHRLWLETNHALTPALKLYESSGFRYIPKEKHEPSPYVRSDVQMEKWLEPEWAGYI